MDKELAIVVPTEAAAYEVVHALKGLDDEGSIELYSSTVVVKTASGALTVKDKDHLRGGWATALGLSTGALIGLLAGPVGVAVGAAIGGAAGLGEDLAYSGFAGDFVQDVAARLLPGATPWSPAYGRTGRCRWTWRSRPLVRWSFARPPTTSWWPRFDPLGSR